MASNSSGPASPLNAAEAEELAAQFRPVWDEDAASSEPPATPPLPTPPLHAAPLPPPPPPPEPAPEPVAAVAVPVPKPTMKWAPGSGPQGYPAPAPAEALPAPAPRKKAPPRAEAPTPEVRELTGGDDQVSSDGSVAMAIISGPVLPPKASEQTKINEPSIVVQDIAATARAIEKSENENPRDAEARRRQTVRLDDIRQDPEYLAARARLESGNPGLAKATASETVPPRSQYPVRAQAPLPQVEDDDVQLPTNNNRKIVFGVLGVAAIVTVLGLVRASMSSKDDLSTVAPSATTAAPHDQGARAATPAPPDVTATTVATHAPVATTTSPSVPARPTQTLNPSQLPADTSTPKAKAVAVAPIVPPTPVKEQPKPQPPPPADKKAGNPPATKGGIVRENPF